MQKFSTQGNQQLIRYMFSKVIERLEQNIRKQIDWKYSNWNPNVLKYNKVKLVLAVLLLLSQF